MLVERTDSHEEESNCYGFTSAFIGIAAAIVGIDGIVAFVTNAQIPADNNASERDIRPIAVYRKVTGETRSENGSQSLAHWMSLTQTLRKNDIPVRDYVCGLYEAHRDGRPPPSVFSSH